MLYGLLYTELNDYIYSLNLTTIITELQIKSKYIYKNNFHLLKQLSTAELYCIYVIH